MKIKGIVLTLLVVFGFSCSRVPITGRRQVNLLPEATMLDMSLTSYRDFLSQSKLSTNTKNVQMLNRVGTNISNSVAAYMKSKGKSKRIENFKWEFNLVEDSTVNAWAMPGGKVVFYTGILQYTQTETGMAVVMGHEVAHAVARHGNERMSQALVVSLGGVALEVALANKPAETQNLFLSAYGLGATVGLILPYSRLHESEADKMGLVFMSMAGYNPNEAVDFWSRMAAAGGAKPPEFLSTHPSDERRIKDLKEYMPEAMKYYKAN